MGWWQGRWQRAIAATLALPRALASKSDRVYSLRQKWHSQGARMSGPTLQNLTFVLLLALIIYVSTLGGA